MSSRKQGGAGVDSKKETRIISKKIETLFPWWQCAKFCEMNEPEQNVTRRAFDLFCYFCCCFCIYIVCMKEKKKLFCHNEMLNELKREQ